MVGLVFLMIALIVALVLVGTAGRRQVVRVPLYIRRQRTIRRR